MTAFLYLTPCSLDRPDNDEEISTSETSVYFYESTLLNIQESCNIHTRLRGNLKYNIAYDLGIFKYQINNEYEKKFKLKDNKTIYIGDWKLVLQTFPLSNIRYTALYGQLGH
jgi:hypothetical protein